MVLDDSMHKFAVSVGVDGSGKDRKVVVSGVSTNNLGCTVDKDRMDIVLMVVSMVGMMCSGVAIPYGS